MRSKNASVTWYQREWKDERRNHGDADDELTTMWFAAMFLVIVALYYWTTSLCLRSPPVALQVPVISSPDGGSVGAQHGIPLAPEVFVKKWRWGGWTQVEYS